MRTVDRILVAVLLVPPWALLLVVCYWLFLDNSPPMRLLYQHPNFLSESVITREEARRHELIEVGGGQRVWVYREFCQDKPHVVGEAADEWVSDSVAWQAPMRTVTSNVGVGCYQRSFGITAPATTITRTFAYRPRMVFSVNPMVTAELTAPDIHVTVRASKP